MWFVLAMLKLRSALRSTMMVTLTSRAFGCLTMVVVSSTLVPMSTRSVDRKLSRLTLLPALPVIDGQGFGYR